MAQILLSIRWVRCARTSREVYSDTAQLRGAEAVMIGNTLFRGSPCLPKQQSITIKRLNSMNTPRGIIRKLPNTTRQVLTRKPRIMRIPPVGIMNRPRIMRPKPPKRIRKNTATNRVTEPR
jgi:hypothetical protein